MHTNKYYVYMLASKKRGVIYIGLTDDITRRTGEYKSTQHNGFTKQYFVRKLVYFEIFSDAQQAALRERQMKKWNRDWKVQLIEKHNLNWEDLYDRIV